MKVYNIKHLGILIFSMILCFSCEEFLEENPEGVLTVSNFYNTEADAISAINAVYASVQSGNRGWGDFMLAVGDVNTDDSFTDPGVGNASWQAFSRLNIDPLTGFNNLVWNNRYKTIARANLVINNTSPDLDVRDRVVAEAKFFRAWAYFDLVRFYGDVPFTIDPISTDVEAFEIASVRTPSVEIYNQMEQDLLDAEAVLPATWSGGNAGRASSGAAKGMLAKVYLTWAGAPLNDTSKFQLAADKAAEVVNGSGTFGYALEEVYIDAFQTKLSEESLFQIQGIAGLGVLQGGSLLGITTFPRGLGGILGANWRGNALSRPTPDLVKAFEPEDLRLQTGIFSTISNGDGVEGNFDPHYYKYVELDFLLAGFVMNDGDVNQQVLRYADVLLMYAEALNEVGSPTQAAYDAINEVRDRAGLTPLSGLDQSSFREAVYLERRLELFAEGGRRFDLIRWGRYVSTMETFRDAQITVQDFPNPATETTTLIEKNIQPHHVLLPIPQGGLDILLTDENLQNPGY